jgi:hypothetical protein
MKQLLLFLAGAAALSAAPALVGGPFVVNVTRNTATVVWIVKSDELTLRPPAGAAPRPILPCGLTNGIHYIGSGGGGAPRYDVDQPPPGITQKVVSVENFVTVALDGKSIHIQALDIAGQKIDEVEIKH